MSKLPLWLLLPLCLCRGSLGGDDLPAPDLAISEAIDLLVEARLRVQDVEPAPLLEPAALLRRTTLDLVGRIPTLAETRDYLAADANRRRAELVDRLLAEPQFVLHQASEFNRRIAAGRGDLREYFRRVFAVGRPWNEVYSELIRGASGDPETKGAERFLKDRLKDLDRLTNDVSVAFFGVNISCAQCHDHPLVEDWKQDHYYGMKKFFSRTFDNGGHLAERDHGGEIDFKTTAGESKKARLIFLSGEEIPEPAPPERDEAAREAEKKRLEEYKKKKQPPPPPEFSRREQLVRVALDETESEFFSRAIVNRIWHGLLGRGLVEPIDQMHSENPPSHPALIAWLARDLRTHGYDLKRLIGGIVRSHAYARTSRWSEGERPVPELFAVGIPRPLSPEQYAFSLRVASTSPGHTGADVSPEERRKRLEHIERGSRGLAGKITPAGENFQVTVDEALYLSNAKQIHDELIARRKDRLTDHLRGIEDPAARVEEAVWAILSRAPTDEERATLTAYLADCLDDEAADTSACEQLVWALLTSSEFRFNH